MTAIPPEAIKASASGETLHIDATASTARVFYGEAAAAYEQGRRDERARIRQLALKYAGKADDREVTGIAAIALRKFADLLDGVS